MPKRSTNSLDKMFTDPRIQKMSVMSRYLVEQKMEKTQTKCADMDKLSSGWIKPHVIDAEIAVGQHAGKRVFLPRIPLSPSDDDMFPFKLRRKQFPVRLCFAMTINKAQGQTIPNVGVYLPEPVFSHDQLYVALSRGISRGNTKVLVKSVEKSNVDEVYTSNVVYKEVLSD
ncbi:hypothetical protein LXL04_010600 [Taraxacum kok-saghyz]